MFTAPQSNIRIEGFPSGFGEQGNIAKTSKGTVNMSPFFGNRGTKLYKSGLELKKNSKSPFGDYQRKNGRQMQKCSRQIVQEQKLKLGPHLIGIVFGLRVDCSRGCGTDRNTRYGRT